MVYGFSFLCLCCSQLAQVMNYCVVFFPSKRHFLMSQTFFYVSIETHNFCLYSCCCCIHQLQVVFISITISRLKFMELQSWKKYYRVLQFILLLWAHAFPFPPIYNLWPCDFPGGPVAKTLHSQCRGPGSIPDQGTRSHMLQLRSSMPQLKILRATTKRSHMLQLKIPHAAMKVPCAATKTQCRN